MCLGCAAATDSTKPPYKGLWKSIPAEVGAHPSQQPSAWGICHRFLQKMCGCRGLIAVFLQKWCRKRGECVRRGRSVGRAHWKVESGNPPLFSFLSTGRVVAQRGHRRHQPRGSRGSVTLWFVQTMLRNCFWLSAEVRERPGLACFLH